MAHAQAATRVHQPAQRRRTLRFAAAAVSAGNAAIYLLIALGVAQVVEGAADPGILGFGLVSFTAYALGTYLLLAHDRRWMWLLGAAFQFFAIVMYVQVAPERTPPYEAWGLLLKASQAALLAALVYLALTAPARRRSAAGERRPGAAH